MHATDDLDQLFHALADATRRDIVRRAITGTEGVAELADRYPMSFAAVQKHVSVLERAGLVVKHQAGRRKLVHADPRGLEAVRRALDAYERLWRDRMDRMEQIVSEPEKDRS